MKNKKTKIITFSILLIAVIFSVIFAVGASNDASTPYYKVVYMDIDDYRKDLNNLVAPEYPDSDEYIFAGWFTDDGCTTALGKTIQTGAAYAKFVPKSLLGIKAQVNYDLYDSDTTNDDTKTYEVINEETGETEEVEKGAGSIRFVTSVDSLNYAKIGFVFDRGNGEEIKASTSVYKTLYATVGETDVNGQKTEEFVPSELFDESSVYFKTWTYSKVPSSAYNTEIKVTPFWITLDGTTVKAEQGIKTVNQGRSWEYVYVDSKIGSDDTGVGTKGNPYATLNKALGEMKANYDEPYVVSYSLNTTDDTEGADGIVCIKDTLTATDTFTWENHDMDVIITSDVKDVSDLSTVVDTSTVDFSALSTLNMGDGASFEYVEIKMPTAVYACGNRLKVSDTSTVDSGVEAEIYGGGYETAVDSTNITLLTGTYACIYGGSRTAVVNGNTYVYVGGKVNSTINVTDHDGSNSVWAGCRGGKVYGNTELIVAGEAKFHYIRGGGAGSSTAVNGTAYVTITENAQAIGVNGGGSNSGSVNNTYVVMKGGTVEQVFGGAPKNGGTVANSNVIIEDGSVTRRIYGGSYNEWLLGWQDDIHVDGYSSVTLGPDVKFDFVDDDDNSLVAVSRHNTNLGTEIGVMIVNPGVSAELGFNMSISGAPLYTHFLVNVVEDGASGTVTSESGVLRITPDNASNYAIVKDASGTVLFYCQGEGTYHLPELSETISSPEELTVSFDTTAPSYTEDIVAEVSYGDGNVGYYTSLEAALASVSTPQVAENQVATVTVYSESVNVASTIEITDGDNVVIKNKAGQNLTFTRDENLTDASMFNVAFGSSLSFKCNDGTVTVDGAKVDGLSMIDNAGTFVLGEGATLQNGSTAEPPADATTTEKNVKTYQGGALYNTGVAYIQGTVQNNSAYYGGAIYIASDGIVELETNNSAMISGNSASYQGGAIFINRGTLNASGYLFTNNSSTSSYGGAIYINAYMSDSNQIKSQANLYNCTFGGVDVGNSATAGGAILVAGSLVADACTFEANKATSASGGAIEVYETNANFDADIMVTNSTFTNNTAPKGYSGAIDINGGGNGVDGTDNVQISDCSFSGNSSKNGGAIAVRRYGAQIDISNLTFEGDGSGSKNLYILQPDNAEAYEAVAISGLISNAEIYIAKQPASDLADETKAPIVINGYLSSESDITVTPAYTYVEGIKLVAKSDDTVSDITFKNAIKVLDLAQVAGNYWFIDSTGCLSQVSAIINGTEGSYADVLAAIADTTLGAVTIEFLRDIEIADTITIPAGADITITNASGVNVTLTRTGAFDMFNVASGGTLTIGNADTAKTITIDGGYGSMYTTETAPSLIQNAGTLVVQENVTIQNASTNATSNPGDEYKGGALYNTGTATLKGNFNGNIGYNGGVIYGKGGTVTIEGGTYLNNTANSNGGVIAGSSAVVIEEGIFQDNTATATGGVAYLSGTLEINDGTFHNNTAKGGTAGVIYCNNTLNINGGTFYKNTAKTGGGVINVAGTATIKNATMYENSLSGSTNAGGAIYVTGEKTLDLQDCNIYNNALDYVDDTNPGSDVSLGGKTILNLYNNTNVGVIQLRYQTESICGTISVKEAYTGQMVLLPFDNVYTIGLQVVTFADGTSSCAENIVVRRHTSACEYDDETYCVDTDGLLQYKNAEAKVGTITYLTLAEAVTAAESGDTVYVLKDVELGEIIAIGDAENTKEITITNAVGKNVTITRTSTTSLFTVASGSTLTIGSTDTANKFIVDGGSVYDAENNEEKGITASASMIVNEGTFNLKANAILQNANVGSTSLKGGALSTTGTATIDGTLKNNRAYQGGAIYVNAPELKVTTSATANMEYNYAAAGGAVYVNQGTLESTGTTFSYNKSTTNGGAVVSNYNTGYIDLNGCTFGNNESTQSGGAVYARFELEVEGCTFENNAAGTSGGAICIFDNNNNNAKTVINNSTFTGNSSSNRASAIDINGGESTTVTISGGKFSGNDDAGSNNSTIHVYAKANPEISDCTFSGNKDEETDRIYLRYADSTLGISGKISDVEIVNVAESQLIINETISDESSITISPTSYEEGTQILTVGDSVSAEELAKAANIIAVTPNSDEEWYISHEGILLPATVKAQVGSTYYTDVDIAIEDAIATLADADSTAIVYVLQNETMDASVTVSTGTLVVTNAPGKDVELTRGVTSTLFTVEENASLQIGADTSGTMIIDGGYVADPGDNETSIIAGCLISNGGTFTLQSNATIQNARTACGTKNNSTNNGAALYNTSVAYLYGNFINNTSYNGGSIWNYGGTLHVYEGDYKYNEATAGGGALYNSGTATLYVYDGYFYMNTAGSAAGGAIHAGGTLTVTGGNFENNKAKTGGGAINVAGTAQISEVTMTGGTLTATSGTFYGGAAILVGENNSLVLKNSNIYNNASEYTTQNVPSCDIRVRAGGTLTLENVIADDKDNATTEQCFVHKVDTTTLYYIDSDGNTLVEVE